MKKHIKIIISLSLIAALILCYAGSVQFIRMSFTPRGYFTMDEELDPVNGTPNPTTYLGFKNGKLYYYFEPSSDSIEKRGQYEIDENGARLSDASDVLRRLSSDDADYEDEEPYEDYDEDNRLIKKLNDIYKDYNGVSLYTVADNTVIYLSEDYCIKEVDIKTHKCLYQQRVRNKIIDLTQLALYGLDKHDDNILLYDCYSNGQYAIYNVKDNYAKIYSDNRDSLKNTEFYKNKLFIGSDAGGLVSVDLNTYKTLKLSDKQAYCSICIFGDKWVYFSDMKGNLYRAAQDGSKTEELFKTGW